MVDDFLLRENVKTVGVFAMLAELRIWLEVLRTRPGLCELVDQNLEICG